MLQALPSSSLKTRASDVARCPASEHGLELRGHVLAGDEPLHEHRAQSLDQLGKIDLVLAMLGQHLVDGRDGEYSVDGVGERLVGVDLLRPRLEPQQGRDGLEVVLDPVVDLLGEHPAQDRPAVLERDGGVVGDRLQERPVLVRERRVPIADQLADLPPLPAQRQAQAWAPARPSGQAILPSSSTSAAPVACSDSIVVRTIACRDSSR